MIRNYRDLTRWEMEQVDRENTIVPVSYTHLTLPTT